ncbi:MAG: hypothetical protein KME07_14645 [Pegethrix bostrychoides GSE-TBD4-15B]|jgi:hypothetical protein|uniref:Uncharacterized protein n=1 Tax=Pegethrix bostrychoides GSE-TBD4-15B TaxID=2839662 RepID=A0A951PE00_9CYAN|nr:hypothetical protein [Pegethrix bostrychoides GSE-TBD4-15B]
MPVEQLHDWQAVQHQEILLQHFLMLQAPQRLRLLIPDLDRSLFTTTTPPFRLIKIDSRKESDWYGSNYFWFNCF